jgi:hypothetical protein
MTLTGQLWRDVEYVMNKFMLHIGRFPVSAPETKLRIQLLDYLSGSGETEDRNFPEASR